MKKIFNDRLRSGFSALKNRGMSLITACTFICCFLANTSLSANTAYTGMRNITSMQLVADMDAGWNLSNTLDAVGDWASGLATETMWGNPLTTKAMIDAVRLKGFKTIRIPVSWGQHLGGAPNYTIDVAWLNRVEEVVNYAFANDMYVIINTHHDNSWIVPTYANQAQTIDELTKVWIQIANRFKNYGDYLIFETLNETRLLNSPEEWNGGTAEGRDVLNKFHLAAVNAIRATGGNNASRHLMVSPYAASDVDAAINDLVIPNNDARVIISWHNYSPFAFSLDAAGTASWGTAADKADLDATFTKMYNKFIANGRAVVIGEFSPMDKNNTDTRAAYADYYVKAAKAHQMAPIWWDGSIINRNTITWTYPTIADALVGPWKNTGPVDYTWCANENGSFALPGTCDVAYGGNGMFNYLNGKTGTITFNNATFGDPAPGVVKAGYYKVASGIVSGGTYTITARHSGKAVDVVDNSSADGANVDQWANTGGANQQFVLTDVGSGYYKVIAVNSGKALDVTGASTADGANVEQWTYGGGTNQQWQFVATGDGYYQIKARNCSKCLDVYQALTTDGANVQIYGCGTGYNQQFSLSLLSPLKSASILNDITNISNQSVIIYPNPATNIVNINLGQQGSNVSIYDVFGRLVYSVSDAKSDFSIPTSAIGEKGVYFVKTNSQTKKLIIK